MVSVGLGGEVADIIPNLGITDLRLSWTKSQDSDVVKYHVYYGNEPIGYSGSGLGYTGDTNPNKPLSPIYVPVTGNVDLQFDAQSPSVVITGLIIGQPYWFSIAAVDGQGRESSKVEITDVNDNIINLTPRNVGGTGIDIRIPSGIHVIVNRTTKGVSLTWQQ